MDNALNAERRGTKDAFKLANESVKMKKVVKLQNATTGVITMTSTRRVNASDAEDHAAVMTNMHFSIREFLMNAKNIDVNEPPFNTARATNGSRMRSPRRDHLRRNRKTEFDKLGLIMLRLTSTSNGAVVNARTFIKRVSRTPMEQSRSNGLDAQDSVATVEDTRTSLNTSASTAFRMNLHTFETVKRDTLGTFCHGKAIYIAIPDVHGKPLVAVVTMD